VPWSRRRRNALETILRELSREGVAPGDRRQFKTVTAVQAFAYLCGADEVQPEHLEVAQHCLWDAPDDQPPEGGAGDRQDRQPTGMRVTQLLLEVESVLAATDVRNLAEAAKAAAKLGEIDKQFARCPAMVGSRRPGCTSRINSRSSSSPRSRRSEVLYPTLTEQWRN